MFWQLHHIFRCIVDRVNIGDLLTFQLNPALFIEVIDSRNHTLTIGLEVSPKRIKIHGTKLWLEESIGKSLLQNGDVHFGIARWSAA